MTGSLYSERGDSEVTWSRRNTTYAYSKLCQTVDVLCVEEGNIKVRLYRASDILWAIHPDMLPPDIREHLLWVRSQLTRFKPLHNEGSVAATLRRIRLSTAKKIAERILLTQALTRTFLSGDG